MNIFSYFQNLDYETTAMLFKLFCVIGIEFFLLIYLYWCSRFRALDGLSENKSKKAFCDKVNCKKVVRKKMGLGARALPGTSVKGFSWQRWLRICKIQLYMGLYPLKKAL